ncbi:MAG: hypothetical protein LBT37_04545 [Lactobacillaceae bacterium]|jgi:hypothetical protein|nr:hypothetical protein [Lactobacillaceae bacterium]
MVRQQLVVPDITVERIPGWCLSFVDVALGTPLMSDTAQIAYDYEIDADNVTAGTNAPAGVWSVGFAKTEGYPMIGHVWFYAPDGHIEDSNGTFANYAAMNDAVGGVLSHPAWSNHVDGINLWIEV